METTEEFILIEKMHPRIAKNMKVFWGSEIFIDYTTKLITDTRNDTRLGFSKEVMKAIMYLIKLHDDEFPRKPGPPPSFSNDIYYKW